MLSKAAEASRRSRQKLKDTLFDIYGSFCVCCGENDRRLLTFDHSDGSGAEHRRRLLGGNGRLPDGNYTGYADYNRLFRDLRDNYNPAIKVRCWNCNSARGRLGVCPHELTLAETIPNPRLQAGG